ncbi:anthranilate phosphoribosyltransferase [Flavobacterium sp. MAH-1]|uniref:Anthranilate phosphoribosyltransferase n=1 Tax=Flavobacterium agri TaxID=2743471 RepID=A0A7Y9C895_9FLAO|nr:anthranilate phosphoribosyltransferase [Flavobacterium agri]NUY82158.1 anthranilate phosphoribosyltransferase [Flavobacterium agri]NYA72182.1 anthranilate phosphoribosyltransferase [Flavobacterium agri]
MKTLLHRLTNHETLSKAEAYDLVTSISNGAYNPSQIAAFLTVYMMRPVAIAELSGFREALLDLCFKIDLSEFDTIDLCGTGGDGKDTFNISTLASLVVAGCGIKVAKHGNYGVSSVSGSSNVMEALGVKFSNDESHLKRCIDKANICILHAPLFHPAMKNAAPIRKELGVKTFFNLLGPLVNPSFPKNQLSGVFSLELARMYAYLLQDTSINFRVLHALDEYDEISLTGNTKLIANDGETVLTPSDFGLQKLDPESISGGKTVNEAVSIFSRILNGQGTSAQNSVVCANAAVAIAMMRNISDQDAFEMASESLLSGKALQTLQTLQRQNQ